MKAFATFYNDLLPELPGCTTQLLDLHLVRVARDFCDATCAWQDTFPTITVQPETLTYIVDTPEVRSEVVKLLRLTIDGELQWAARPPAERDHQQPRFPAHLPPFALNADADEVTFAEQPTGDVVFVGAMRPALDAISLPDLLRNQYLEIFRAGVLSRLMAMGGKPWTDRELSGKYAGDFAAGLNFAAVKAARGNTLAPLRTRPTRI